ncbi:Sugar (pentulose or hexulose) kinase [Alkalispirochaeta americana]|uniref:Sugar (Pentulose or hexulose) kinase n=1 Tax=Alkalispirochaeta americana TaxID=159291 RepID=A0A1N6UU36_9SPIO|nr:FGGY-family carbohydrate kinase [Alkalispirochaeta americana]SIQ69138.1 Sugar (pentulose or hexulose) kinase [Alkalispirochaeta americana]
MNKQELVLGIELGSTRIKTVLIDSDWKPVASGSYTWQDSQVDGFWSYPLDDAWQGLKTSVQTLLGNYAKCCPDKTPRIAAAGISGMMHGYLPLDARDNLLAPFRTWRNNRTQKASQELSEIFQFPIPQRWSIAHLYEAILNKESHVPHLARLTTLAGYIHYKLTGRFALGINEASGMFPVDPETMTYNTTYVNLFDSLLEKANVPFRLLDILPEVLPHGTEAGRLLDSVAPDLDPTGTVSAETPLCPPEGDAGTGMIATNSIRPRTANVSAGTSAFAMVVLEQPLSGHHEAIDVFLTPDGKSVAMAHSNNCTSDLNDWISLLTETSCALGAPASTNDSFSTLLPLALQGDSDAGGLTVIPYRSGEHLTGFTDGLPLFLRSPGARFSAANLMRAHLFSALTAMRIGLDVLRDREGAALERITGHGGFFTTPVVGQRIAAAVIGCDCSVMETAGEGGSWGMALLAAFLKDRGGNLPDYLDRVFAGASIQTVSPTPEDLEGFAKYYSRYKAALASERSAVDALT